jgi:arginine exporter protein ArgO
MRRGLAPASAAGAGAATADLLYASLAAIAGVVIARSLEPAEDAFRILGALVLIAIAVAGVLKATNAESAIAPERGSLPRTFLAFLGLTLINPLTVVYFTALILGLDDKVLAGTTSKVAFVAGAFLASLSWQLVLAGAGGLLHRRLTTRARLATAILGNLIVIGLALRLLLS